MPVWKTEGLNASPRPCRFRSAARSWSCKPSASSRASRTAGPVADLRAAVLQHPRLLSPTAEGRTVCSFILAKSESGIRLAFQTLPDKLADPLVMKGTRECEFDVKTFPCWFSYNHNASPLLYQGLAYVMSVDGVLHGDRRRQGRSRLPEAPGLQPPDDAQRRPSVRAGCSGSPTLAGRHIYLWDDQGTCVVIEPGRTFKLLARNRIDRIHFMYGQAARNECMISNPVFSGKRIYVRGENHLYCIAEEARR